MGPTIAIHANPALQHQQQFGEYFLTGFKRHGIKAELTSNVNQEADVHVVLGPHYARDRWAGYNTLLLDRGWWGDPAWDVSIGWMGLSTGMLLEPEFCDLDDRLKPELLPMREGPRCIGLLDYSMPDHKLHAMEIPAGLPIPHFIRHHPACAPKDQGDLLADLKQFNQAIGYRTSALVTALIHGVRTYCLDTRNPAHSSQVGVERERWLNKLSYHHYNGDEIASGLVWENLCQSSRSPNLPSSLLPTRQHATT